MSKLSTTILYFETHEKDEPFFKQVEARIKAKQRTESQRLRDQVNGLVAVLITARP
jgi:hypothetical protein